MTCFDRSTMLELILKGKFNVFLVLLDACISINDLIIQYLKFSIDYYKDVSWKYCNLNNISPSSRDFLWYEWDMFLQLFPTKWPRR
jgi:hypothetical protein